MVDLGWVVVVVGSEPVHDSLHVTYRLLAPGTEPSRGPQPIILPREPLVPPYPSRRWSRSELGLLSQQRGVRERRKKEAHSDEDAAGEKEGTERERGKNTNNVYYDV